jgi:hypothetical protein
MLCYQQEGNAFDIDASAQVLKEAVRTVGAPTKVLRELTDDEGQGVLGNSRFDVAHIATSPSMEPACCMRVR